MAFAGKARCFFIGVAPLPTTRFRLAGGDAPKPDYWWKNGHFQYRPTGKSIPAICRFCPAPPVGLSSEQNVPPAPPRLRRLRRRSQMPRHSSFIPAGVIPAVLLSFDDDLAIDETSFRAHLRHVG